MDQQTKTALTGLDDRGRSVPKRISPFTWVEIAARAGVRLRAVPAEFWTKDDGHALVACPCGHRPRVSELAISLCECQRAYFYVGTDVFALNAAISPPNDS